LVSKGDILKPFLTILLQIHSGNCIQKIDILDLSLIQLLQNQQGSIFMPYSVVSMRKQAMKVGLMWR